MHHFFLPTDSALQGPSPVSDLTFLKTRFQDQKEAWLDGKWPQGYLLGCKYLTCKDMHRVKETSLFLQPNNSLLTCSEFTLSQQL